MMSSISTGSISGLRRSSACITSADRVSARTLRNMPPLERPIGVRTASTTTTSFIGSLPVEALAGGGQGGKPIGGLVERTERPVLAGEGAQPGCPDRVGPTEDAAPERREPEPVQQRDVDLDRAPHGRVLEAARGLEQHG